MDALGINPWILLAQIVNFAVLLVILRAVAYKPIQKMLSERSERIQKQMEDAEFAAKAKAEAEAQRDELLTEARQEVHKITADGNAQLEVMKKAATEEAQQQAEEILSDARQKAEEERNKILSGVRGQITALATAVAQQIIGKELNEERQRALVDSFFSGIREGRVEILPEETEVTEAPVVVTSAIPLTKDEQNTVHRDLVKLLGDSFELSFQVDASILGGLVIHIGNRIIDGSVTGQLKKLQESLA
ncbi:MAG: hypothetical protein B5M51_08815 [Anaerolinea sp. 4484_236]|nr:MAG: hypothetical protein B5M51_08815 [Anaerolinea sp. 4484_236]RLD09403.1 MAG: hypothetical protein DRI56_04365 [Chloroflexota bacterium]